MLRRSFLRNLALIPAGGLLFRHMAFGQGSIQVTPLGEKLHLLSGGGGNIAILEAPDGLLLIDSGLTESTVGILAETGKLSKSPVTRLINTHWHFDHVGGNAKLGKDGAKILASQNARARMSSPQTIAFFNRTFTALPPEGLPTETFKDQGTLKHGAETLRYTGMPPAHTDGDATIHFQNANVFHAGDLLFNGLYPFIDYSSGGSLAGMAANSERIWKTVDNSTKIIPGHGPMTTKQEVKEFHDMLSDCHEIFTSMIRKGKTLEDLQAAQPFKKYDEKWGKMYLKPEQWIALNYLGMTEMQKGKAA